MILSLLLTAVAPQPAPPQGEAIAQARAEAPVRKLPGEILRTYIKADDYPAEAMANEEQGSVGFTVLIGTDGTVKNCTVVAPSGSAALDARTCAIMRERLRFKPARDQSGRSVEDRYGGTLTWQLGDRDETEAE